MTPIFAVEWSQGIEDAWSDVASFVPKFLGFLIILIVGYFVAKAIAKAAEAVLERVGFDRAVERGGIKRGARTRKYDASDILGKIIFYGLFLIVLQMAFGVFGPNPISDLLEGVIAYLPKIVAAILIIVVASAIAAAAREVIDATLGGLSYGSALANGVGIAIVIIGIFAALNQLQIAPAIVTGLFYALLAIVVGSAVIAIGGGGIDPMRSDGRTCSPSTTTRCPRFNRRLRAPRSASPPEPNNAPIRRERCRSPRRPVPPQSAEQPRSVPPDHQESRTDDQRPNQRQQRRRQRPRRS